jgi:SHS family lactate transporter-like MFS transporter
VALLAMASGFGQFGAVAALGSVARTFGHLGAGATFADQAGLSGTKLGTGLAIIRLASLAGLPLAALADRFGRRSTLLVTCAVGLGITVVAAVSPGYWWFVVIFAVGRPPLSATNAVAQVAGAELTASRDRAAAIALIAAGYGVGAGLTAIIHGLAANSLGFRGIFALAAVPLVMLLFLRRRVVEPDRFVVVEAGRRRPVIGPVDRPFRRRLALVALVTFGVSIITGPSDSLIFVYAENVRRVAGITTSAMVVGAGVTGLGGLLVGKWMADRTGRRATVAMGMAGMAGFGVLAYSGTDAGMVAGYVLGVASGGILAPAGGALINELFPTGVRASVAGWNVASGVLGAVAGLLAFGALADVRGTANHAAFAAEVTFLPALAFAALLIFLPETRGREPEDLWPPGFD